MILSIILFYMSFTNVTIGTVCSVIWLYFDKLFNFSSNTFTSIVNRDFSVIIFVAVVSFCVRQVVLLYTILPLSYSHHSVI